MTEKLTLKDWVKKYGKDFNIRHWGTLQQRLKGTPVGPKGKKKPYEMPPEFYRHFTPAQEGRQWFIYTNDPDQGVEESGVRDPLIKDRFERAKIDDHIKQHLESAAKEAVVTGQPLRLIVEFYPEGIVEVVPLLGPIFKECGQEIKFSADDIEDTDLDESESPGGVSQWHIFAHHQWLRSHLFNKTENEHKKIVHDFLAAIESETSHDIAIDVENRLKKHCLWCGELKRNKNPNKRPHAKYCNEDTCKPALKREVARLSGKDIAEKTFALNKRMSEIRMALTT